MNRWFSKRSGPSDGRRRRRFTPEACWAKEPVEHRKRREMTEKDEKKDA